MMNQKNFSETIAYQYHSPSIEQQIVKNMCIQYAHIVGSTSTDIVANIAAYSSPTNRIPNRYQNATSLAVAIGYGIVIEYEFNNRIDFLNPGEFSMIATQYEAMEFDWAYIRYIDLTQGNISWFLREVDEENPLNVTNTFINVY